ncbi:hypothetical protein T492DRAFT_1024420, partial [Pavlovales sp. CCMP2436]
SVECSVVLPADYRPRVGRHAVYHLEVPVRHGTIGRNVQRGPHEGPVCPQEVPLYPGTGSGGVCTQELLMGRVDGS